MAEWTDVDRIAAALPEVTFRTVRGGLRQWRVKDKLVAWERPLRKADFEALGGAAPHGPIVGVRVPDLVAKQALVADDPDVYFTTPHFDGYPAVLIQLEQISPEELEEAIVEAWLDRAPKRIASNWLEENDNRSAT